MKDSVEDGLSALHRMIYSFESRSLKKVATFGPISLIDAIAPTVMIPTRSPYSIRSCPWSSRRNLESSFFTSELLVGRVIERSRPSLSGKLQLRVQIAEVGSDLRSDQLDRRDGANGDDSHEQAVLDQVLAGILTNETNNKILHD